MMEEAKNILVVDDDRTHLKEVRAALEARGYSVETAQNGEEALEAIHDKRPDLILLDIIMPKMSGLEFYDRLTPPNSKPAYPIIVVTVRYNLKELFDNLPVEGFVTKPFKMEDLMARVDDYFLKTKGIKKKTVIGMKEVLIVDDDFENVKKIAIPMIEKGYTVSAVKTPVDAMEKIVGIRLPKLVLMRYGLADHSEFTLTYHLKGIPEAHQMNVVFYVEDISLLGTQAENELIGYVGQKNVLELKDVGYFHKRCDKILEGK